MSKIHAFARRDSPGWLTCSQCWHSDIAIGWCTKHRRDITWDPLWYGCGDFSTRARGESDGPLVITAEMILEEGRFLNDACCFKCKHQRDTPFDDLPTRTRIDPSGQEIDDLQWHRVRHCDVNPIAVHIYGDTRMRCGMFRLDRSRFHSLTEEVWEYEARMRRRNERDAARTATIRGRGYAVLEDWI